MGIIELFKGDPPPFLISISVDFNEAKSVKIVYLRLLFTKIIRIYSQAVI